MTRKLPRYSSLTRTSLDKTDGIPLMGIYVIAYMNKIIYVGKAEQSVSARLTQHLYNAEHEPLGRWMHRVHADWENVRLDVLEPPDNVNERSWLRDAEAALVQRLKPLFNEQLQID